MPYQLGLTLRILAPNGGVDPHNIAVTLSFQDWCQSRLTSFGKLAPNQGSDPRTPGSKPGVPPLHHFGITYYAHEGS